MSGKVRSTIQYNSCTVATRWENNFHPFMLRSSSVIFEHHRNLIIISSSFLHIPFRYYLKECSFNKALGMVWKFRSYHFFERISETSWKSPIVLIFLTRGLQPRLLLGSASPPAAVQSSLSWRAAAPLLKSGCGAGVAGRLEGWRAEFLLRGDCAHHHCS